MIIGGVAGFEIDRHGIPNSDSHMGKTRFISYLTNEFDLTQVQRKQLDSIINYAHPKFQTIRRKFNTDLQEQMDSTRKMIKNILNDQQQQKFQCCVKPNAKAIQITNRIVNK